MGANPKRTHAARDQRRREARISTAKCSPAGAGACGSVQPRVVARRGRSGNLYPVAVDVSSEITIERPVDVVSSFCVDPANVPDWYANIESVNWKTQPSLTTGSQIEFVARFLGRRLRYTYEVVEWVPGERFVMRTAEGPFPMETSYTWSPTGTSTTMRLRNHGEPSGFSKLVAPFMAPAIRRANRTDLRRLKLLLEAT